MKNNITFTSKVKILTHNYKGNGITQKEAKKIRNAFKALEKNGINDSVYLYRGQCKSSAPFYELTVVEQRGKKLFTGVAGKTQKFNQKSIIAELYNKARQNLKPSDEKYLLKYYL